MTDELVEDYDRERGDRVEAWEEFKSDYYAELTQRFIDDNTMEFNDFCYEWWREMGNEDNFSHYQDDRYEELAQEFIDNYTQRFNEYCREEYKEYCETIDRRW